MPKIEDYATDSSISDGDKVIGTDSDNSDATRNYTFADIKSFIATNIECVRDYFSYYKTDDTPDSVVISTTDTYQVYIPSVTNMTVDITDEFSYNTTTGENTYTGSGEKYQVSGHCSIQAGVNNTTVHFALCVNGTPVLESSGKCESTSAVVSVGMDGIITLGTDDVITLQVKSDNAATIDVYHLQGYVLEAIPRIVVSS